MRELYGIILFPAQSSTKTIPGNYTTYDRAFLTVSFTTTLKHKEHDKLREITKLLMNSLSPEGVTITPPETISEIFYADCH